MTKKQFCEEYGLTEAQFEGKEVIKGDLDLPFLTSIPEGFNPIVGWSLWLPSLTSIPEGFNPTVGRDLDLPSLTSIPDGFNPTVGGSLYLDSLTSIPERFNPIVGWSLYLDSLTSIPEGFNPAVGGNLYTKKHGHQHTGSNTNFLSWQDGKYIKVDGIFTEVISKRGKVWKVKKIGDPKEFYLVTDGNGKYAHGDTIKEAKRDLMFKVSNRNKDDFAHLTMDSTLSFEDAIACYRVVTGACAMGVKDFIESNNIKEKEYKVREIVEMTKGRYGWVEFERFMIEK